MVKLRAKIQRKWSCNVSAWLPVRKVAATGNLQLISQLSYTRAVSFSRQPQCTWLNPVRQALEHVLEQGRNDDHSSISLCILSGSTARCHTNHNKSRKLRGLMHRFRKAASRLHECAIAYASFFLLLLECNAH